MTNDSRLLVLLERDYYELYVFAEKENGVS